MTRGGKKKDRDEPERRCIVTGSSGPKTGLVRFVVGPDGSIVADLLERLPGRGIWVSADREAIDKAAGRNLFARAARQSVTVGDDLATEVETRLATRVVELISLARKAGQAFAGYEKVKASLETEEAVCLIQASDGSARERGRLRPPRGKDTHFADLTSGELGMAFGRDRVIHAALIAGGLARLVRYESARLAGLRRNSG